MVFTKKNIASSKKLKRSFAKNEGDGSVLLDSFPYPIIIHSQGKIAFVNKAALGLFGVSNSKKVINEPITKFVHPAYKDITKARIKKVVQKKEIVSPIDERVILPNGQEMDMEVASVPINYQRKPAAMVIAQDITVRKKLEKSLQESERKMRAIFDQTFEFIGLMDCNGILIDANKTALEFEGIKADNVLNKPFWKTPWWEHSPLLQEKLRQAIKTAAKGETVRFEATHIAKDNNLHYIDFSIKPVKDKAGKVIFLIPEGRDITAKKIIENDLRQNEEKYRKIFDFSPEAIVILDNKGKIVAANDRIKDWLGYEVKDIINKNISVLPFLTKESKIKAFGKLVQRMTGKNVPSYELEFISKNGEKRVGRINATQIKNFLGKRNQDLIMISDITEHRKMEEELKIRAKELERINKIVIEEKATDEALLSSMGDGVIAVSIDGSIIFANKSAADMIGYSLTEMRDNPLYQTLLIEDENGKIISKNQRPIYLALNGGKTVATDASKTYYYIRKDKTKFPVSVVAAPIVLNGKIIGAIDVFRDITREKEIDKAKTEFVSLASHQLKTPLTAIRWLIEVLNNEEDGKLTERQKEYVNDVRQATLQTIALVNDLLNISRLEAGRLKIEPKPMQIEDIVEGIIKSLEPMANEKKCKLTFLSSRQKLPLIILDESMIRQIISNLLTNAIRYSKKDNGQVFIKIKKRKEDYLIAVSDNGIGIPSEEQDHIFERFFRAENAKRITTDGSGLGLYLTKLIIQSSGGKIWFESKEGEGTNFYISIPLSGMKEQKGEKSLSIL